MDTDRCFGQCSECRCRVSGWVSIEVDSMLRGHLVALGVSFSFILPGVRSSKYTWHQDRWLWFIEPVVRSKVFKTGDLEVGFSYLVLTIMVRWSSDLHDLSFLLFRQELGACFCHDVK